VAECWLLAGCVGVQQIWPGTHTPLWQHHRECKLNHESYHPYQDDMLQQLKRASESSPQIKAAALVIPLQQSFLSHISTFELLKRCTSSLQCASH
jgi:hypothetical protein